MAANVYNCFLLTQWWHCIFKQPKWIAMLGQSFKDLAKRSHTSLVRMPPDAGKLKIEAYELMWSSATPL